MVPPLIVKDPEVLGYHAQITVRHPTRGVLRVEATVPDFMETDEIVKEVGVELGKSTVGEIFDALEAGETCSKIGSNSVKVSSPGVIGGDWRGKVYQWADGVPK